MAYLKNSTLDFTNRQIDDTILEDYFSFDTQKILSYIATCTEDFFDWYQMEDDDKLERIALSLYGNPNYWDILMIINDKDPLFDMPYNFNTVTDIASSKALFYANKISSFMTLPASHIEYLTSQYEEEEIALNEARRPLRIVKPTRMQEFIQKAYESGCFVKPQV